MLKNSKLFYKVLFVLLTLAFIVAPTAETPVSYAAESAGTTALPLGGDLIFFGGGVSGRYLILENWNATQDYPRNTLLKHNNQAWIALDDPAIGDEPGSNVIWLQVTGVSISQEQVEDFSAALLTGGTHTGVSITYNDNADNAGTINVAVSFGTGTPANVVTGTGSAGTSTALARFDHVHGGDQVGSGSVTLSDSAPEDVTTGSGSAGTAASVSRSDHIHGGDTVGTGSVTLSDATPEDVISGTGTAGTSGTVSRADHTHGGDTDTTLTLTTNTPELIVTSAGAAGSSSEPARADHVHGGKTTDTTLTLASTTPEDVSTGSGSTGTSTTVARSDHVHGGDTDTDTTLSIASTTPEDVSTSGSTGSSTTVARSDHIHGGKTTLSDSTPANVVTSTGSAGTSTVASRSDHVHGGDQTGSGTGTLSDSIPSSVSATAGSAGSNTDVSRSDHVHQASLSTTVPSDVITGTDTGSVGTATQLARADHVHGGKATDTVRTLSDSTPEDVVTSTGSAGTSVQVSRADHVHGGDQVGSGTGTLTLSDGDPDTVGTSAAPGSSSEASRSDHIHTLGSDSVTIDSLSDPVVARILTATPADESIMQYDGTASLWTAVLLPEKVLEVVSANTGDAIDHTLDSIKIGTEVYSVIVRPDSNGQLRTPTVADFDTNTGRSKVIGFDGDWQIVTRDLVAGHAASADDDTLYGEGDTVSAGGKNYRYRDEHHGDSNVHDKETDDFYFDLNTNRLRICVSGSPFVRCDWGNLSNSSALARELDFIGYFDSRDDALAHLTADGQSAVYPVSHNVWRFTSFDNVVVGTPDHYNYGWEELIVLPPSMAILSPFPDSTEDVDGSVFYADRSSDGYNVEIGYPKRGLGDFFTLHSQRIESSFTGVPDYYGYSTGTDAGGRLDPHTGFTQLAWRDDDNADQQKVHVIFAETDRFYDLTNIANNNLRIRYQRRHDTDLYPDDSDDGWYTHTLTRDGDSQHLRWVTEAINTDPFREVTSWIALEAMIDGEWQRFVHGNLYEYEPLLDHIHTNNTLTGDGSISDPLSVSVNEVIEELQEYVRYYTDSSNVSTKGASVGHIYTTSEFQKTVTAVEAKIDPPANHQNYRARIYVVNDSNVIQRKLGDSWHRRVTGSGETWTFQFRDGGVEIPPSERIAVLISRYEASDDSAAFVFHGSAASDSPGTSYSDADDDFVLSNWVEYEHTDPSAGNGTRTHGSGDIYANLKIIYRVSYHHSALVGDGNVDLNHLDSGVTERLLPVNPANNQIARYDSGTSTWEAEDLPSTTQVQSDWDETDTTNAAYIQNKPTQAQSDWDETDTTNPAYIQNKPTIPTGSSGGILLQKLLTSSNTNIDNVANTPNWSTIMTQSVTVADDTHRVYVDAIVSVSPDANGSACSIRIARDGTGVVTHAVNLSFNTEDYEVDIRALETPGTGTFSYTVQAQRTGSNNCDINEGNSFSFATFDVLAPNQ